MYTKKVWKTGDTITADAMNNIEKQVEESSELYDVSYSDTLEWDGDTTGLDEVQIGQTYYKITNQVLTIQQLEHCKCTVYGGIEVDFSSANYIDENGYETSDISKAAMVITFYGYLLMILKDFSFKDEDIDMKFKKGIYFSSNVKEQVYITSIKCSDGDIFQTIQMKPSLIPTNTLILINTDNDSYLYYDGADTTNANNRITRSQFIQEYTEKRIIVKLKIESAVFLLTPATIIFNESTNDKVTVVCTISLGEKDISTMNFYTAEYTPSS